MQIWTIPKINDLYLEKKLPVMIREEDEIKESFIIEAGPGDIAILGIDDHYREFHDEVMERGNAGRILFITPKAAHVTKEIFLKNALILDAEHLSIVEMRHILLFILDIVLAHQNYIVPEKSAARESATRNDDHPIENSNKIHDLLSHLAKNKRPIILAFEIKENGEPVMARGTCHIKEVRESTIALHNFRHSLFQKSLKKGVCIKALFPYKHENKEGISCLEAISENEVIISIPDKLFSVRDIRIHPNKNEPVSLYTLISNEPTTNYTVVDISPRGIGFLCTRDLPIGSRSYFTIILPEPPAVVVTRGIIRHKKETFAGYQYGAEFMLHPWDADSMAKYIMKREIEIMGLLRGR